MIGPSALLQAEVIAYWLTLKDIVALSGSNRKQQSAIAEVSIDLSSYSQCKPYKSIIIWLKLRQVTVRAIVLNRTIFALFPGLKLTRSAQVEVEISRFPDLELIRNSITSITAERVLISVVDHTMDNILVFTIKEFFDNICKNQQVSYRIRTCSCGINSLKSSQMETFVDEFRCDEFHWVRQKGHLFNSARLKTKDVFDWIMQQKWPNLKELFIDSYLQCHYPAVVEKCVAQHAESLKKLRLIHITNNIVDCIKNTIEHLTVGCMRPTPAAATLLLRLFADLSHCEIIKLGDNLVWNLSARVLKLRNGRRRDFHTSVLSAVPPLTHLEVHYNGERPVEAFFSVLQQKHSATLQHFVLHGWYPDTTFLRDADSYTRLEIAAFLRSAKVLRYYSSNAWMDENTLHVLTEHTVLRYLDIQTTVIINDESQFLNALAAAADRFVTLKIPTSKQPKNSEFTVEELLPALTRNRRGFKSFQVGEVTLHRRKCHIRGSVSNVQSACVFTSLCQFFNFRQLLDITIEHKKVHVESFKYAIKLMNPHLQRLDFSTIKFVVEHMTKKGATENELRGTTAGAAKFDIVAQMYSDTVAEFEWLPEFVEKFTHLRELSTWFFSYKAREKSIFINRTIGNKRAVTFLKECFQGKDIKWSGDAKQKTFKK